MSVSFSWSFPQFDVAKSEDGLSDVVKTIHWRYDAADGDNAAGAYGTVGLEAPDPEAFVPLAQITEQWAIDRVTAQVDLTELEASLQGQIDQQKNPPVVPVTPAFAAS